MPAMQFGVPPWYFDDETNVICKRFVDLHVNYVFPYIYSLPLDGQPIVRPMWWLEPTNELTFNMTDQFLVGDDILVAPVLDPGLMSRDIYIPGGEWTDAETGLSFNGPQMIRDYAVTLETIPYFISKKMSRNIL